MKTLEKKHVEDFQNISKEKKLKKVKKGMRELSKEEEEK